MERRTWFTSRQNEFLDVVTKEEYITSNFYLTGGTALAAFYYNHRESEDLDFFTAAEEGIDEKALRDILFKAQRTIKWIGAQKVGQTNYILTFKDKDTLRLDFVHYTFEPLGKREVWHGLEIDSLIDIATNKLDVILQRKKARDYVDFYFLVKKEKFSLRELIKNELKKFDWQVDPIILAKNLLMIKELTDYPKMKVPFDKNKMIKFYENLARSLESEIFK